jgi:polyferredoxin
MKLIHCPKKETILFVFIYVRKLPPRQFGKDRANMTLTKTRFFSITPTVVFCAVFCIIVCPLYCLSDLRLLISTIQWLREIRSRKSNRQYNGQDKSETVNQTDNTMAKRNHKPYIGQTMQRPTPTVVFCAVFCIIVCPLYCLSDLRLLISLGHCIVCLIYGNQTDNTMAKRNQKP